MADVVLVQPRVAIQDELQDRPTLPLSLLMAASLVCRERSVSIIDQRVTPGWEQELRTAVRSGPICVGVTAMTGPQITRALEVAQVVREEDPGVPVLWGGPHATLDPVGTAHHPMVDAVVVGDGELTLWEYVRALEGGENLDTVPGLAFPHDGKVRVNPYRPHVELDELPDPPLHLVDAERYVFHRRGRRCMNISTVRGCQHRCTFCATPLQSRGRWHALSAARTLDLTESLVERHRLGYIWYMEQCSMVDQQRVLDIGRGLLDRELDVLWEAEAYVNNLARLSDDEIGLLSSSGLVAILIGVESGSQHMVDKLCKGVCVDDVVALNRRLAGFTISPWYSFMCGFPGETREMLDATLALMVRLISDNPRASTFPLNPAIPFPGTPYMDMAVQNGLVPPDDLASWADYEPHEALAHGFEDILPWVSPERAALLRRLHVATAFLGDASSHMGSQLLGLATQVYRPVARARLASGDTRFMGLEESLYWGIRQRLTHRGRRRTD